MAIVNPGIPNGGFTVPTPPVPRTRVNNPGIPNGGFTSPVTPANTTPTTPPAFQQSLTNYSPGADYGTYSNYAPVGSAAWAKAYGMNPSGVMANLNNTVLNPYSSGMLAQANGINSGLAKFLMLQNHGLGSDQFLQSAGFTNAPGSQTTLNQAGREWSFANDPTYGGARDAAGHRQQFGFTPNGVPYSYEIASGVRGDPNFQRWAQTGQGQAPTGVTLYNQFALPSNFMANLNSQMPQQSQPNGQPTMTPTSQTAQTSADQTANPYGAGYTGFGNTHISSGPTPSAPANTNPTGAGPQGQAPGTAGSFVAGPPTVTTPNTNTSAIPRSHISNPAVGMPSVGLNGLPNNSGTTPDRNTLPVAPAPRVSGNYNMAINQNHAMNRY